MEREKERYKIRDEHGNVHVFESIEAYQDFIMKNYELFIFTEPGNAKPFDAVHQPAHYANRKYEVIDVMKDTMSREQFVGYLLGATLKYLMRWDKKDNPKQDLQKAHAYLTRLIQTITEEERTHAMARN